jgi:hypothetical protein
MIRVTIQLEQPPDGGWAVRHVWVRIERELYEAPYDPHVYRTWQDADSAARRVARQCVAELGRDPDAVIAWRTWPRTP